MPNWKHPIVLLLVAIALVWAASKYMGEKSAKIFASPIALLIGAFLFIGAFWKGGFLAKAKDIKSVTAAA